MGIQRIGILLLPPLPILATDTAGSGFDSTPGPAPATQSLPRNAGKHHIPISTEYMNN